MPRYDIDGPAGQNHILHMGPELGTTFHGLWAECVALHQNWNEFVVLFGTSPDRIGLMNDAAPGFFKRHQDMAWQAILLHIGRLTDPANPGRKHNLSLERLRPLVNTELSRVLDPLFVDLELKVFFARDWRNRYIAHTDFELATTDNARPLESGSRLSVKEALAAIGAVMDAVENAYTRSTTSYSSIRSAGGAERLLYTLRDGLTAEKQKRERFRAGTPLTEDLRPSEAI